ncbi:uncharacterized protein [Henckelia pumila]|uniref:uncharacterized protein n=1 Tax=Henckelia pumila TaxID=405737 RepID=UPI003C6E8FD9
MGLSTKQVCNDRQDEDRDQALLQPGTVEPPKSPPIRQQQPRSESLKCPRCSSTNTKFCYFNNYNKSQPRHFCKSCKRHWTKGGTLRNVPVGGGRKNRRPKISNTTTTTTTSAAPRVQTCGNFPSVTNIIDHKITYNTLYQSLILPSSPLSYNSTNDMINTKLLMGRNGMDNTTGRLNVSEPQNLNTEFTYSNLNTFEMNSSSIMNPTSYQSLHDQYYPSSFESMEESTITTVNIPSTSSIAWPGPGPDTRTTGIEDFPNFWNCIWKNEIELSTSSDINIVWDSDEIEIKP